MSLYCLYAIAVLSNSNVRIVILCLQLITDLSESGGLLFLLLNVCDFVIVWRHNLIRHTLAPTVGGIDVLYEQYQEFSILFY